MMKRMRPDVLINTAAWTAVDAAEDAPGACHAVNAEAVEYLADACRRHACRLVQISTDYVFGANATRSTPYCEDDAIGPLNAYGHSKAAGEIAARSYDNHLIIRTCGLFHAGISGPVRGRNFLDTMLCLAEERNEVSVINDQRCTPSYVPDVAAGILALLAVDATGTFHITNQGETSWSGLAKELFRQAGKPCLIREMSTSEYSSRVARPGYSVLSTTRFTSTTQMRLPTWETAVAAYVNATQERITCSQSS